MNCCFRRVKVFCVQQKTKEMKAVFVKERNITTLLQTEHHFCQTPQVSWPLQPESDLLTVITPFRKSILQCCSSLAISNTSRVDCLPLLQGTSFSYRLSNSYCNASLHCFNSDILLLKTKKNENIY